MQSGRPIIILKENVERNYGKEDQRSNMQQQRQLPGAVKSTLGPRGMDEMPWDQTGDIVITNDGATILGEIAVQRPGATMVIKIAATQDDEVGDGTTTAVVIVDAL